MFVSNERVEWSLMLNILSIIASHDFIYNVFHADWFWNKQTSNTCVWWWKLSYLSSKSRGTLRGEWSLESYWGRLRSSFFTTQSNNNSDEKPQGKKIRKSKERASLLASVSQDVFTRITIIKSAFKIWNFVKKGDKRIKHWSIEYG